jgi:DNA-binding HxlR family transcriptional regulator
MKEEKCDISGIWEILGKRWSLHILRNLSTNGIVRFNELKRLLPGISSTVLSERLLELEHEGLITKKIYPEIPIRIEYSLTTRTMELESILKQLSNWVDKWKNYENKHEIAIDNINR